MTLLDAGEALHREKRSGREWTRRAAEHLKLQADFYRYERFNVRKLALLDAVDLLENIEYLALAEVSGANKPHRGLHVVAPSLNPIPATPARVVALCGLPVKGLVARLMQLDGTLTDAKLLKRLSKQKLASMIYEREFARSAETTWAARA